MFGKVFERILLGSSKERKIGWKEEGSYYEDGEPDESKVGQRD